MKSTFSAFPEVLLVDATYKLTELWMPVYLMMVVDGNGQSEIVCSFVTVLETEESMSKMIQVFKSHNPAWASSRVLKIAVRELFLQKSFLVFVYSSVYFTCYEVLDERLLVTKWESELEKGIVHWKFC